MDNGVTRDGVGTLALFMTALLFYMRYWILRVFKAIDLLAVENADDS